MKRGFAVLPMLVFVALLGVIAVGVESFAPQANSRSQTAVPPPVPVSGIAKTHEQICIEKKKEAMAERAAGRISISKPESKTFKKGEDATLDSKCVGARVDPSKIDLADNDLNKYKCVGLKAQVNINPDGGGVISSPSIGFFLPAGKCEVRFCEAPTVAGEEAVNCTVAVELQGSEGIQQWSSDPTMNASMKSTLSSQDAEEAPTLTAMNETQAPDLYGGATEESTAQGGAEALQAQVEAQAGIVAEGREFLASCGTDEPGSVFCSSISEEEVLEEERKLAELEQRLARLKAGEVALSGDKERTREPTKVSTFGTGGPGTFNVSDNTFNRPIPIDPSVPGRAEALLQEGIAQARTTGDCGWWSYLVKCERLNPAVTGAIDNVGTGLSSAYDATKSAVSSGFESASNAWTGYWSGTPGKIITDQVPSGPNTPDTNTQVVTYPGEGTIASNASKPVFPIQFESAASQQPLLDLDTVPKPKRYTDRVPTEDVPTEEPPPSIVGTGGPGTFKVSDNTLSNSPAVVQAAPPAGEISTMIPAVASAQEPPIVSGVAEGGIPSIEGAGGVATVNPWKGTIARSVNPGFVRPGAPSYFEDIATTLPPSIVGTGGPGTFKVSDNTSSNLPPIEPPIVSGVAEGGVAHIEGIKASAILPPPPPPVSTQIVTVVPRVPLATPCSGSSLANCLSSNNLPSDFYARKTLADALGIDNYTGTADQNIALLDDLVTNGYVGTQFSPQTALYRAASNYEGDSVVGFLSAADQPSSFGDRAALARKYGITGYKGTAKQNQKLLAALRATIRQ